MVHIPEKQKRKMYSVMANWSLASSNTGMKLYIYRKLQQKFLPHNCCHAILRFLFAFFFHFSLAFVKTQQRHATHITGLFVYFCWHAEHTKRKKEFPKLCVSAYAAIYSANSRKISRKMKNTAHKLWRTTKYSPFNACGTSFVVCLFNSERNKWKICAKFHYSP